MTAAKQTPAIDPATTSVGTGAPPVEVVEDVKPLEGQVIVTSPTGTRSVVSKDAVDALKVQGYKVG